MPRPLAFYTVSKMNRYAYIYGVTRVRKQKGGNIGPALINIEESKKNPEYKGYDLHEDGWAFSSPLSWHPNCKKGMFSETNQENGKRRLRIVYLDNYIPSTILSKKSTPDNITYAKSFDDLNKTIIGDISGYFEGKSSGKMLFNRTSKYTKSEYLNYTDDNKTFYNGYEHFEQIDETTGKLTSLLNMTGEKTGEMNLTITMNMSGYILNKSGYAKYNGKTMKMEEAY